MQVSQIPMKKTSLNVQFIKINFPKICCSLWSAFSSCIVLSSMFQLQRNCKWMLCLISTSNFTYKLSLIPHRNRLIFLNSLFTTSKTFLSQQRDASQKYMVQQGWLYLGLCEMVTSCGKDYWSVTQFLSNFWIKEKTFANAILLLENDWKHHFDEKSLSLKYDVIFLFYFNKTCTFST